MADGTHENYKRYDFTVIRYRPVGRGEIVGAVAVQAPSGLQFHELLLLQRGERRWVQPPSRPMVDREGRLLVDERGRARWAGPLVTFTSQECRERFYARVIAAVEAAHPGAFG